MDTANDNNKMPTYLTKVSHVKGNTKDSGKLQQNISFINGELRRGTWELCIQSIACVLKDTARSPTVLILSSSLCLCEVEEVPGIITIEHSPLAQFEIKPSKKAQICYISECFWVPVNYATSTVHFNLNDAFTKESFKTDCEFSITYFYRRIN